MPDVFLSYSREDQSIARHYAEGLQREGLSVWWDQALHSGEAFDRVTEQALADAAAVVVLWSKHSVESDWVRAEAAQARANGRLVPVMIEPCKRPIMFELTHTADLAGWKGDPDDRSWRAFVDDVRRFVGAGEGTGAGVAAPNLQRRRPRRWIGWVAAAVVAVAAGAGWYLHGRSSAGAPPASAAPVAASIAVLPFENISSDPDQEFFADGLTEEILNSLARIPDLKVTARTSSFYYKGRKEPLKTIGETLGVAHLLEGSVRRDQEQLRITVQLVRADSGFHVFSKTYDRPRADIFNVQEDIARAVAEALQVTLGVGDLARIPGMTRNFEAYEAYVTSQALLNRLNPEASRNGLAELQRAVTLDPEYGQAWALLALAANVNSLLMTTPAEYRQGLKERSEAALAQAQRLVPDSPFLQTVLAQRAFQRRDWVGAEQLSRQAIASAEALGIRVNVSAVPVRRLVSGYFRESIRAVEQQNSLDPLNPRAILLLGEAYADSGDFASAMREWDRGLAIEPRAIFLLGGALLTAMAQRDQVEINRRMDAILAVTRSQSGAGGEVNSAMQPLLDRPREALAKLRQLAERIPNPDVLLLLSEWMAWFGDPQGALSIVTDVARRGGSPEPILYVVWRPVMSEVRRLPGFKGLLRELNVVDYYRQYGWPDLCQPTTGDDFECH